MGQVSSGSYEHTSGMVMVGYMSNEVIRAFILKALMQLVFIRTFPSCLIMISSLTCILLGVCDSYSCDSNDNTLALAHSIEFICPRVSGST